MTATLHATSTYAASVAHPLSAGSGDLTHAVARPVVDGLDQSACGVLVTATAGRDWSVVPAARRCEECARIAG
jgi:copper(I)-binding protein